MKNSAWLLSATILCGLSSCSRNATDEHTNEVDSIAVANGAALFQQDCSACHSFIADGIGPSLSGVSGLASHEWIEKFIKDPKTLIESGDKRASDLYSKFKTIMPSFGHYSVEKVNNVIAYLETKKVIEKATEADDPAALKNPIPAPIDSSSLVADLRLIAKIPFSSEEDPRTRIVKLDYQPGTDKLFILDLRGKLYFLNNGNPEVYFDIAKERKSFINKPGLATGFGSFAFHPEFAKNGLMYTTHSEPPATQRADFNYNDSIPVTLQWVVTEWKTDNPGSNSFQGVGRELLRIDMVSGIHGMQEATFNPASRQGDEDYGLLYIGIGDGGSVENKFPFLVHNGKTLWGSIIRIDPSGKNSANGKYGIPKANPFYNDQKAAGGEIYAYGFRNPHKITWLSSGKMMASNIGHGHIESFNMIGKGDDFGWPIREGTFVHLEYGNMNRVYPLTADDKASGISYPVIEYDHDEGKAISSGYDYRGKLSAMAGKFFFADIVNGRLFYVEMKDIHKGNQAPIREWKVTVDGQSTTMEKLAGKARVDVRLGRDRQGELYVFTKPDGKLYKVVKASK